MASIMGPITRGDEGAEYLFKLDYLQTLLALRDAKYGGISARYSRVKRSLIRGQKRLQLEVISLMASNLTT
jgi:hypothetical protein